MVFFWARAQLAGVLNAFQSAQCTSRVTRHALHGTWVYKMKLYSGLWIDPGPQAVLSSAAGCECFWMVVSMLSPYSAVFAATTEQLKLGKHDKAHSMVGGGLQACRLFPTCCNCWEALEQVDSYPTRSLIVSQQSATSPRSGTKQYRRVLLYTPCRLLLYTPSADPRPPLPHHTLLKVHQHHSISLQCSARGSGPEQHPDSAAAQTVNCNKLGRLRPPLLGWPRFFPALLCMLTPLSLGCELARL